MNCQGVLEDLALYIDGELSPEDKAQIEKHLAGCNQCRIEYLQMQKTVELLRSLAEIDPPADFRVILHRRLVRTYPKTSSPVKKLLSHQWFSFGAVAAGLLLLAVSVNIFSTDFWPGLFSPRQMTKEASPEYVVMQDQGAPQVGKLNQEARQAPGTQDNAKEPSETALKAAPQEELQEYQALTGDLPEIKSVNGSGEGPAARNGAGEKRDLTQEELQEAPPLEDIEPGNIRAAALTEGEMSMTVDKERVSGIFLEIKNPDLEKTLFEVEKIARQYDVRMQAVNSKTEISIEMQVSSVKYEIVLEKLRDLGMVEKEDLISKDLGKEISLLKERHSSLLLRQSELEIFLRNGGTTEEVETWQDEFEKVQQELKETGWDLENLNKEQLITRISLKIIK